MTQQEEPGPVEQIKGRSRFLLGEISDELTNTADHFGKESVQLLKHHGTYQQDDRDARAGGRVAGQDKVYMFMVRTRVPGGKLTADQMLAQLDLCDELGNNTLRITSRQGLQLHGIVKSDLQETIARINATQLTTWGACGDVNRNVMCCPAPFQDTAHRDIQQLARLVAQHLAPRSSSYHSIWLREPGSPDKQLVAGEPEDVEPIYGRYYLPRKFKIGIGLSWDNCIDVYTHDVGLLAITKDGQVIGYNVLVGGGFGMTPSAKKTFAALARPLCFATPDQVMDVVTAIVKVQRDFGNRADRKVARLKYLINDWGLERFAGTVEQYFGNPIAAPVPEGVSSFDDHLGWHEQGDGRLFYGLNIENGRLKDTEGRKLKSAVRAICDVFRPGLRLTAHQSLLFTDIGEDQQKALGELLTAHGVQLSHQISQVRRWSMACVAWPTCGLSIAEAERALPGLVNRLERELAELGLADEQFTLRMTGCPNGCARPYNAVIGLVGKAKGRYTVYLGGNTLGTRLAFLYKDLVPEEDLVPVLTATFACFKEERLAGESLGDFYCRQGPDRLAAWHERQLDRRKGAA